MKPLGMSVGLQVLTPSRAEDAIWNAVQEAIAAGIEPERFREEAAEAWEHELREAGKDAAKALRR